MAGMIYWNKQKKCHLSEATQPNQASLQCIITVWFITSLWSIIVWFERYVGAHESDRWNHIFSVHSVTDVYYLSNVINLQYMGRRPVW